MHLVRFQVPLVLLLLALVAFVAPAPSAPPSAVGADRTWMLGGWYDQEAPKNPNPGVVPPHARPHGLAYADWGVRWWRWALSFPARSNPLLDPTGSFNQQGQSGDVFFLAGNTGGSVERSVTIPQATMIFFPIIAADVTYPCPDASFVPGRGQTLEEFLQSSGDQLMGGVGPMRVELDGRPLSGLAAYRAQSRISTIIGDRSLTTALDACITGAEQSFVSDGYWLMLQPLEPGSHTLHVTAGIPAFGLSFDVTYHIAVTHVASSASAVAGASPLRAPVEPKWRRLKIMYR